MMCFVFEMLFNLSTFYRCYKNDVDYTICCIGRCTDNSDNYFVLELPKQVKRKVSTCSSRITLLTL